MKKLLALIAIAGTLTVPAALVPTAASAATIPAKCVVLPLLQKDCRAAISEAAGDIRDAAGAAAEAAIAAPAKASVPVWTCERTKGGKALFSCSEK